MATAAQIASPQSQTLYDSEKRYSVEEYLAMEEIAPYKNEFQNGYIYPMPGGTYNHNLIASNTIRVLGNLTQNLPSKYRVLNSDMKIHIPEDKTFVYPDALVICEKPEFYLNHKDVITNPLVVVEVLSSSTEAYDRGGKFDKYSSIESFREYILIKQDRFQVVSYFREETDLWRKTVYMGAEAAFFIKALAISIPINEIYDGVEF
jgi:Uma2 family endonuclease